MQHRLYILKYLPVYFLTPLPLIIKILEPDVLQKAMPNIWVNFFCIVLNCCLALGNALAWEIPKGPVEITRCLKKAWLEKVKKEKYDHAASPRWC